VPIPSGNTQKQEKLPSYMVESNEGQAAAIPAAQNMKPAIAAPQKQSHMPAPAVVSPKPLPQPKLDAAVNRKIELPNMPARDGKSIFQRMASGVSERYFKGLDPADLRRQLMAACLIPVLAIGLILLLMKNMATPGSTASPAAVTALSTTQNIAASSSQVQWQRPDALPESLPDPMGNSTRRRVVGQGELVDAEGQVKVKGLLYSEDRPAALIGTDVYYVGDAIGDIEIVKITRDNIGFKSADGREWQQTVVK